MNNSDAIQIADKGKGFGMESYTIDGNNLLEVYRTISQLRAEIQKNLSLYCWNA